MSTVLRELAHQVREACAHPRYGQLKAVWTRHNRLQKVGKIPVSVHLHRGYTRTWKELIPPERLLSRDPLERNLELQLRQKLYRHHEIPDDDVLLPTIWLEPVRPSGEERLWGVALQRATPDDPKGAYTFLPIVREEADIAKLHYPRFEVDEPATQLLVDRARDLLGDLVPVKLFSDEIRESPGERIIDFLGNSSGAWCWKYRCIQETQSWCTRKPPCARRWSGSCPWRAIASWTSTSPTWRR